jgi:ABC-2 type transport system permease protein
MLAIYKKELVSFFSSLIGYVAIAVFLVLIGVIMWVFPGNTFDNGFANLDLLFDNAPLLFILLIPAITMRSFSEEKKSGTLEILATRPISELQVILGKYFAACTLVFIALLPTLLYYYTIYQLGAPKGNLDSGAVWGSYLGLFLLSTCFVSIGIFSSSVTDNQIVSFMLAAFLCFAGYQAFDSLSGLDLFGGKINDVIQSIGMLAHYDSISRGVVDSRDAIYFLSVITLFILLTKTSLESRKW